MRKKTLAILTVTAAVPLAALAQTAVRQTAAGASPNPARQGMSLQAFQARHERKIFAADTDGDGRVSRAEFLASAANGKGDPAKRFAKLDRNGDGYIDKAEADAMLARRFKRLDTDGDGIVTPQERAAAKAAKQRVGKGSDNL